MYGDWLKFTKDLPFSKNDLISQALVDLWNDTIDI